MIPEKFKKGLRGHKLMCTLINKSSGIFGGSTKEIHSSEVSLAGLTSSYQTSKQITYEKVKFDVVVRVRQAYGGKETEVKQVEHVVIERHIKAFDQFEAELRAERGKPEIIQMKNQVEQQLRQNQNKIPTSIA